MPPHSGLAIDLATMLRHADAWDALAASAISPNPYFSRNFITAHAHSGTIDAARLRFIVPGNELQINAVLPLLEKAARFGWARIDSACTSPYMMAATPLVGRDAGGAWAEDMLEAIRLNGNGGAFIMPRLALDTEVAQQMIEALRRLAWQFDILDRFERPVARIARSYEEYADTSISRNRRRGIKRVRQRLEERGSVRHEVASGGPRLTFAVETFLALEARGWKGERRTALASRPETTAMLRLMLEHAQEAHAGRSVGDVAGGVNLRADILLLDEKPLAISLGFVNCDIGFMWKITLDEAYRKFAPGVILEDSILQSAHENPQLVKLDSATGLGTPLDSLYGDRDPIGDLVFAPPSLRRFQALLGAEKLRRQLRAGLKSLRDRWLRRD